MSIQSIITIASLLIERGPKLIAAADKLLTLIASNPKLESILPEWANNALDGLQAAVHLAAGITPDDLADVKEVIEFLNSAPVAAAVQAPVAS